MMLRKSPKYYAEEGVDYLPFSSSPPQLIDQSVVHQGAMSLMSLLIFITLESKV